MSVGSGLRSSSARAVSIMPGVQKPHCSPCSSWKPCCTGSRTPSLLEALDRRDLPARGRRGEQGARLHGLAVHEHDARSAVGRVAAPVRARLAQLVAQEVHEQQPRLDVPHVFLTVDRHRDLHQLSSRSARAVARRSARRVSSPATWRLYSADPRWSVTASGRCGCEPRGLLEQLLRRCVCRRAPARRSGDVTAEPTAASAIPACGDRAALEPHRGAGGGNRPVAHAPLDLLVGAARVGVQRDADLRDHLAVVDGRLVGAAVELAHADDALPALAADHDVRIDRRTHRGEVLGRVGLAQRAADRARLRTTGRR